MENLKLIDKENHTKEITISLKVTLAESFELLDSIRSLQKYHAGMRKALLFKKIESQIKKQILI